MDDEVTLPAIEPTDETPTLSHFEKRITAAADFNSARWEKAFENQRFVSGGEHQWDAEDWAARKESKRPAFSMNDIALAVNSFSGKEITNRFQPTALPRSSDDGPFSNICREVMRAIRDKSFAEQVESDKFRDLGIEGYAFVEWAPNYLDDPLTGRLQPDGMDLHEMMWDPTSRKMCLMDREWDARGKWISIDEFLGLFPDKRDVALGQLNSAHDGWVSPDQESIHRWPWLYRAEGRYISPHRREVFVADYQYRVREPMYLAMLEPTEEELAVNPNALPRRQLFTEDQWLELVDRWKFEGLPEPDFLGPRDGVYRWKTMRAFIAGKEILRDEEMQVRRFNRICMTGVPFKQQEATIYKGFVDYMTDGQRFQNEVISLAVAYLARGPKGPLMFGPGAFDNEDMAMKQLSTPMAAIKMRANWKEKVEWGPDLAFPQALGEYLAMAQGAVWRPLGTSPAALGQVDDVRRVSGTAFSQISSAGQQAMSTFFDTLRLYRRLSGELILAHVPLLYDQQTLAELLGPELGAFVPPKDEWASMLERDVIVEEVLSTKSEQEAAWDYGSRQGTWEKLLMQGLMPPQIFVKMIPSSWLPEPDKKQWVDFLLAQQQAQQAAPEGQPQESAAGAPAGA